MQIDWPDLAVKVVFGFITTTVPIALYMYSNRAAARKDIEKKHEENQRAFARLMTESEYFPAHEHREASGPLTAEGIRKPRRD